MKISEVTLDIVKTYLRVDYDDEDTLINSILQSALSYILHYTGLTIEQVEQLEDITSAYLILIQDMFDNRSMYVNNANVNRTVSTILDMHSKNNVGG